MAGTTSLRRLALLLLTLALAAALAAGCAGRADDEVDRTAAAPSPVADHNGIAADSSDDRAATGATRAASQASVVVRPTDAVVATSEPGGGEVVAELAPVTEFGSARALLVVDRVGDDLEVLLPVRPNGTTGWIPAADHELRVTDVSVDVDLTARRLTVLDGGDVILESDIGVGTDTTPTPPGRYAVTDLIATPEPGSPYGPFALGLSGYSDVVTDFAGGDGQLGIHGTNDPASIGTAASFGCVRVPNDVVTALVDLVPLGAPVTIRA